MSNIQNQQNQRINLNSYDKDLILLAKNLLQYLDYNKNDMFFFVIVQENKKPEKK